MRNRKGVLVAAALLTTLAVSGTALADRGGGHFGGHGGWRGHSHGFGHLGALIGGTIVAGALLSPWYYRGPYYASYPTVVEVVPSVPTVYIEQPQTAQTAAPDAGSWWYYCNESRAYYPYVKECPSPWQRVSPTPPSAR